MSKLLVSLGHALNTQTLTKINEQNKQKKSFKYTYEFVLGHILSHPGPHEDHGLQVGLPWNQIISLAIWNFDGLKQQLYGTA